MVEAGISDFWDNTLRRNLLLLEHFKIKNSNEWDLARFQAWATGNFKNKAPKDILEIYTDKISALDYKRDDKRAEAAFAKYKQIDEAKRQHKERDKDSATEA